MFRKIAVIAAYLLLFVAATVLFLYFSFPLERLKEFAEYKVNSSARYRVHIDSIERNGLGQLVFSDVSVGLNRKLIKRPQQKGLPGAAPVAPAAAEGTAAERTAAGEEKSAAEAPADEFSYVDIESITVDFSILDLLNPASTTIGISMELLGGSVTDGEIELDRSVGYSRPAIRLPTIEGLSLGETEFFASIFSAILPSLKTDRVSGTLEHGSVVLEPALVEEEEAEEEDKTEEGETEETENAKDAMEPAKKAAGPDSYYAGSIAIELIDIVALSPILVQSSKVGHAEVPLTDMRLGACKFVLRIDRKDRMEEMDKVKTPYDAATVILFEEGQCKGESLDYFVHEGSFILIPPKASLSKGQMDFWTRLAFSPDYFDEKRTEDGQVVTKNVELGQGLEFDPKWQKSQDVDGYYWMHCKGTLARPKCMRRLPPAEEARRKAQRELEKSKKAADKAAAKAAKPPRAPRRTAADLAREKAEERRKQREAERRARPTLDELRTPGEPAVPEPPVILGSPAEPALPEEPPVEAPSDQPPDVVEQPRDVTPQHDVHDGSAQPAAGPDATVEPVAPPPMVRRF